MTKEEAVEILNFIIEEGWLISDLDKCKAIDACEMAIKALEQESESKQFAEWVAREIFDEYWEYNKDAFAELACRKLAKLGIVRANGGVWELVEPQESEEIDEDNN